MNIWTKLWIWFNLPFCWLLGCSGKTVLVHDEFWNKKFPRTKCRFCSRDMDNDELYL